MNPFEPASSRWTGTLLSVLRMVAAFLFFWHGTQKMFGVPSTDAAATVQALDWFSQRGVAAFLEVVGGTLLFLGAFTRPVAFILSGEMAVAYFIAHVPRGLLPNVNRGEVAVLYCFIFLYIAAAGVGRFGVDAWLRTRRETRAIT